jgi:hypothetical protein
MLCDFVQERLAAALAVEVGVQGRQMSQLKKAERQALLIALTAWPLPISSHEGYKKAEVTGGGVPLEQVDCKTMESRVSVQFVSGMCYTIATLLKCALVGGPAQCLVLSALQHVQITHVQQQLHCRIVL